VTTETRRVHAAVADLKAGRPLAGELLLASPASLRDDYECSSPELDWFVEQAVRVDGVRVGRAYTARGWGGARSRWAIGGARVRAPRSRPRTPSASPRGPVWHTHAARGAALEAVR
jgi:galactokinase